ncbi:glycosyltransferase family 2 protein [Denitrobaculum tricleocarpae]|uniref:Glycosyltransferase family 2 protein n=1 Tax=Denitrobaculum tricleocarpae TaxID=2591009 RepID=A0A545TTT1_9PROT|nr:glycosyltransferase family 2 protein [Denitrobaculum tricleocarpae]TQV80638.1 glycosyltransferase family 2 protein [Denitrobaculum tricleocarpae]
MRSDTQITTIIPALNEEASIGKVIAAIPDWVTEIIVVDNGSSDNTAGVARDAGATVLMEPRRGYGQACQCGLAHLQRSNSQKSNSQKSNRKSDVVVFLDADYSDYPGEMDLLVDPIVSGLAELVIGSRTLRSNPRDSLTPQQRAGNSLACALIRLIWRTRYTDLGPFRAISRAALDQLDLRDRDFGWTVEMQIKASQRQLKIREVPVSYRRRIGQSKISGTLKGTILAGTKIIYVILAAMIGRRFAKI